MSVQDAVIFSWWVDFFLGSSCNNGQVLFSFSSPLTPASLQPTLHTAHQFHPAYPGDNMVQSSHLS